ncbi:MAG: hypothetical protein U5K54_15875 [Cytophagales bacterium]|nr:hypothetical protein [Cytophagales bacterium]
MSRNTPVIILHGPWIYQPYLSPALTYYHKSGFYLHSSVSYLTAKGEGRIDMMTLSGGYDYYRNT